ncbi:MAG: XRE family transcriptional regulator [Rhodospirillales bacterium]
MATIKGSKSGDVSFQDPHRPEPVESRIESAIGRQVREFRRQQNMTVAELAKSAGLSTGMLSKIENGATSPSLTTLQSLSAALQVPVTALFRRFEERREATHVKSGHGLRIDRRGTRAGHQYELLGHIAGRDISSEPYLITLTEESDVFPVFQHEGLEFIYLLEGRVRYRHADKTYLLEPGDSLFFDADAPHGPEELIDRPIRMVCVICYAHVEKK